MPDGYFLQNGAASSLRKSRLRRARGPIEEQLRRRMQIDELKSRAKGLAKRVRELEERDDQKRLPVNPFATPKLTLVP